MDINSILPFVSSGVMLVFVVVIFRRFIVRGGKATPLLLWGIGLLFFFFGSLTEALHAALGWNDMVFRLWYLCGAVLVAAWLGQGTVELLVRRHIGKVRLSHIVLAILTLASIFAAYKVFTARVEPAMLADRVETVSAASGFDDPTVLAAAASVLEGTALDRQGKISASKLSPLTNTVMAEASNEGIDVATPAQANPFSEAGDVVNQVNGQTVRLTLNGKTLGVEINGETAGLISLRIGHEMHGHAIVSGGTRVLTPFFNSYGTLMLAGGALYSAWIFFRKRILPNRVTGNILIAVGSFMPGIGGLLSRFGLGGYLYVGELLGAILIFTGFLVATNRPEVVEAHPAAVLAEGR